MGTDRTFASIVVPTRNRPQLLRRALTSIGGQTERDFEVVVVDDGSTAENRALLEVLARELDARFRFVYRAATATRNGPAAARNVGIATARGQYVGFLDDDDCWCDSQHLSRARHALMQRPDADLYLCNQASRSDEAVLVTTWLPHVERLAMQRPPVVAPDVYEVGRADLLRPEGIGFAHVNMCLVARGLLEKAGGFWEPATYEEDLEWFLRVVDASERILYRSATVVVQSARPAGEGMGASSLDEESCLLLRMLACERALLHCRSSEVRRYAGRLLGGCLKTLSKRHHEAGRVRLAARCARQAVSVDFSVRWLMIASYLQLRALASPAAIEPERP
jgi:GT2 family glycosyltransferase